jgi:hypothetical protein
MHVQTKDRWHTESKIAEYSVGGHSNFYWPPLEDGFAHGEFGPLAEVDLVAVEVREGGAIDFLRDRCDEVLR